jgi:hypothetical protein
MTVMIAVSIWHNVTRDSASRRTGFMVFEAPLAAYVSNEGLRGADRRGGPGPAGRPRQPLASGRHLAGVM